MMGEIVTVNINISLNSTSRGPRTSVNGTLVDSLRGLLHLDVSRNNIWEQGAKALAENRTRDGNSHGRHQDCTPGDRRCARRTAPARAEAQAMSMDYIRNYYDVPAKCGGRIRYSGNRQPIEGTIIAARGAHLLIRLDGDDHEMPYHPTWKIEYLPDVPVTQPLTMWVITQNPSDHPGQFVARQWIIGGNGNSATADGQSIQLQQIPTLTNAVGQEVILGVRPEFVSVANQDDANLIKLDVDLVETLGSEALIHASLQGEPFVIRTDTVGQMHILDGIRGFTIKPHLVKVFDAKTGAALPGQVLEQ